MKQCSFCRQWKDEVEFYKRGIDLDYYCKKCHLEKHRIYRLKSKDLIRINHKKYYQKLVSEGYFLKHRKKISNYQLKKQHINLQNWIYYLSKNPQCEICQKKLQYFVKGNGLGNTVHFDHKDENCIIKDSPGCWLRSHCATSKNLKIWKSCNFGVLCMKCNTSIPTKNRKEWLQRIIKYIG